MTEMESICDQAARAIILAQNDGRDFPAPAVADVLRASLSAHLANSVDEWFEWQEVLPKKVRG